MNVVETWLRRRAVRRMAARLPRDLAVAYGRSEFYTVAQIDAALERLDLHLDYRDVAYAAHLPFDVFFDLTSMERDVYDESRALYRQFIPRPPSAQEPAEMNEYISQSSGLP